MKIDNDDAEKSVEPATRTKSAIRAKRGKALLEMMDEAAATSNKTMAKNSTAKNRHQQPPSTPIAGRPKSRASVTANGGARGSSANATKTNKK